MSLKLLWEQNQTKTLKSGLVRRATSCTTYAKNMLHHSIFRVYHTICYLFLCMVALKFWMHRKTRRRFQSLTYVVPDRGQTESFSYDKLMMTTKFLLLVWMTIHVILSPRSTLAVKQKGFSHIDVCGKTVSKLKRLLNVPLDFFLRDHTERVCPTPLVSWWKKVDHVTSSRLCTFLGVYIWGACECKHVPQ